MRRFAAVVGALVIAMTASGVVTAAPAAAETRTWSTGKGVIRSVKVAFDHDFVVLSMKARAPRHGGFTGGTWFLKTTDASQDHDFSITWSHHEPAFQTADGTYIYCDGIERAVGRASVRFGIPVACLEDADGVAPEWIRSRIEAGVEGSGPHGGHVARHGTFPAGGGFTAAVQRDAEAG